MSFPGAMYILRLLMITFLMKPSLGELFAVGARLITNATQSEHQNVCSLLIGLVPETWQSGGFQDCVSMLSIKRGSNLRIISYKITVDPSAILGFPKNVEQFELFDFLNLHLNPSGKRCSTMVGPSWWTQEEKHDTHHVLRMLFNKARLDAKHSACSIISDKANDATLDLPILLDCWSDKTKEEGSVLIHSVMLKVKAHGYQYLKSEGVYKDIKLITDRVNGHSEHCVLVTNVVINKISRSIEIVLQFKVASVSNDSCKLLLDSWAQAYLNGGFVNCESFYISSDYSDMGIRMVMLRTGIEFNGVPLVSRSETELALRTEVLFNMDAEGCITHEPSHVARLLRKTEEGLTSFISAPPSVDLCEELMKRMDDVYVSMYKSCALEMRKSSEAPGQNLVLYRLAAREPFHAVDEPFYLNYLSILVNNLNWAHSSCLYNGYIEA